MQCLNVRREERIDANVVPGDFHLYLSDIVEAIKKRITRRQLVNVIPN